VQKLAIVGGVLCAAAAYPIFLQTREALIARAAYTRYEVTPQHNSATLNGHEVTIGDELMASPSSVAERYIGPVEILIDGEDYSTSSPVEIRAALHDAGRYHNWVRLIRLRDRKEGTIILSVVQRLKDSKETMRFRILVVDEKGSVTEDVFGMADRAQPVYRVILARFVSPYPIGFHSEVLQVWPSVIYPIVYPWLVGLVGFGLLIFGLRYRTPKQVAGGA
jgi:hypothetical protein